MARTMICILGVTTESLYTGFWTLDFEFWIDDGQPGSCFARSRRV